MKYIFCLLIMNFTISCNSQTFKEEVINSLNNFPSINANYSTINFSKGKVVLPSNINNEFKIILNDLISKDTDVTNLGTCEKYLINYKVKTLTSNFISIEKSVSSMFCENYDDINFQVLNLFLANDGKVYNVQVKKDNYITDEISKFILTADVDCQYSSENIRTYLIIDNNEPKLFIVKDKVCNELIDLNLYNLDLIIN